MITAPAAAHVSVRAAAKDKAVGSKSGTKIATLQPGAAPHVTTGPGCHLSTLTPDRKGVVSSHIQRGSLARTNPDRHSKSRHSYWPPRYYNTTRAHARSTDANGHDRSAAEPRDKTATNYSTSTAANRGTTAQPLAARPGTGPTRLALASASFARLGLGSQIWDLGPHHPDRPLSPDLSPPIPTAADEPDTGVRDAGSPHACVTYSAALATGARSQSCADISWKRIPAPERSLPGSGLPVDLPSGDKISSADENETFLLAAGARVDKVVENDTVNNVGLYKEDSTAFADGTERSAKDKVCASASSLHSHRVSSDGTISYTSASEDAEDKEEEDLSRRSENGESEEEDELFVHGGADRCGERPKLTTAASSEFYQICRLCPLNQPVVVDSPHQSFHNSIEEEDEREQDQQEKREQGRRLEEVQTDRRAEGLGAEAEREERARPASDPREQFGLASLPAAVSFAQPYRRGRPWRRGSSVTFYLPTQGQGSASDWAPDHDLARRRILQQRFADLFNRRMSAPELPPIPAEKARSQQQQKHPSSRAGSRTSLNHLSAAITSKNFHTRLTLAGGSGGSGGAGVGSLPRNHSDSSLRNFFTDSHHVHLDSRPASGLGDGGGGGGEWSGGGLSGSRSASRALSWCATENSTGSVTKLDTVIEGIPATIFSPTSNGGHVYSSSGSNNNISSNAAINLSSSNNNLSVLSLYNSSGSSITVPGTPPPPLALRSHDNNHSHPISGGLNLTPRSASVDGVRRTDLKELTKLQGVHKVLYNEGVNGEQETLATIEQFGRLKFNDLRRVNSDNRLADRKNARNARPQLSLSKAVAKLTPRRTTSRQGSVAGSRQNALGMRRSSSVSAINHNQQQQQKQQQNNSNNNVRSGRLNSNVDSDNASEVNVVIGGGSEDSEGEDEKNRRIKNWLIGLEFADEPEEAVFDYADDPPQTDTALHIVYQEEA